MIDKLRGHLGHLLTWLNYAGSILLAYALANPGAMGELVGMLPASLRSYAPALALAWFGLVQWAKLRAVRPVGDR
jgi:hypothetical protein